MATGSRSPPIATAITTSIVVPATGGKPKQLTFHSADDNVVGWRTTARRVIFSSARGQGRLPQRRHPLGSRRGRRHRTARPHRLGRLPPATPPTAAKLAFMRHPAVWSRKHYRGSLCRRPVGRGRRRENVHQARRRRIQRQLSLAHVRRQRRNLFRQSTAPPTRKTSSSAAPKSCRASTTSGRFPIRAAPARPGHPPHRWQPLLPQHLRRPQDHRLRRQLRPLEARRSHRQDHRNPHRHQVRLQGERYRTRHHQQRGRGLQPLALQQRAAVVVHGEIFTIATDRGELQRVTETPWREQDAALVAQRQVDRLRFRPHRPPGSLDLRRTRQDSQETQRRRLRQARHRLGARFEIPALVRLRSQAPPRRHRQRQDRHRSSPAKPATSSAPQFSPDGKWLSYSKQDKLAALPCLDQEPRHRRMST